MADDAVFEFRGWAAASRSSFFGYSMESGGLHVISPLKRRFSPR